MLTKASVQNSIDNRKQIRKSIDCKLMQANIISCESDSNCCCVLCIADEPNPSNKIHNSHPPYETCLLYEIDTVTFIQ